MDNNRDLEKEELEHVDEKANQKLASTGAQPPAGSDGYDPDHGFSLSEQRRIVRHIDRRLVVILGVMYCVSLMDRTNLSAAAIAGMTVELDLLIENRYVSLLSLCLDPTHPSNQLTCPTSRHLEHCLPHLLRPLHHLPTSLHRPDSQNRSPCPPVRHLPVLGRRHDWYGLRQKLW